MALAHVPRPRQETRADDSSERIPTAARPDAPARSAAPPTALPWNFGAVSTCCGPRLQPKLTVAAGTGPLEHEADRVADAVMAGEPAGGGHACAACASAQGLPKQLARKYTGDAQLAPTAAPPIVGQALRTSGTPLPAPTRSTMERRFGYDFGHVRVHHDGLAARSSAAVNALAYTVGSDIVFGESRYAPGTSGGDRLLAHELAHVVQQGSSLQPRLQRFVAKEVPQIAPTFQDMLTQVRKLIADATRGDWGGALDWDFFVEISGGQSAGRKMDEKLGSKDPTIKSRLFTRYLITCRCGMIDMRHFLQLLYISNFTTGMGGGNASRGNRAATDKGREHELTSEPESRFAPEDTTSNALGAATNLSMPALPTPDRVFDEIKDTLARCDPLDWSGLSQPSKDQIVHFYGDQVPNPAIPGKKLPKNPNETAVPDILPIAECGGRERSLPFELDTDDPDRKTYEGKNFLGGSKAQTSASDIRGFVYTQRDEIIKALPLSEKIRFIEKLSSFPFFHRDKVAIEKIYKNSTADELRAEP